ncbi:extracellular solute-binding protein [Celeribacter indicus]|uniref:ABC transporter substrate-binding protein n=1 Tax=Celeribacter indicus TaxID=1208324 RepID=A0A0B5E1I7_9RHOB|nr:extracellular solute-binding protein [Celeribacter indicus]AJE47260.1 ABC transporter substrate-binding protein [Celeribacter indicus]SDW01884.1 peptide/nickel transport system substrate-binding protein [Celeribacter indicus]
MAGQSLRRFGKLSTFCGLALALSAGATGAEPQHGLAMYGEPELPADFTALPYVRPDAPKGGAIVTGEGGSFDSLNPFIQKGNAPWQLRFLMAESLMAQAFSEPFTLYCLLCETVETDPARSWVEFTLRPEARFSDGSPVTVEDVMWSYEVLGTEGHGRYAALWDQIETMEQTGERSVKFTFNTENRELPLLVALRPILKKAYWDDKDFTQSGVTNVPVSSAPYVVSAVDPGMFLELSRNPDYWGKDLPLMRGQANFDTIRFEYFADASLVIEAFKAGALNAHREFNIQSWEDQYDFPAAARGDVVKSVIPHQRPTGMTGFAMNTRQPQFSDWRVRQAMIEMFNFDYVNEVQTGGQQSRITSYYSNSPLGMRPGPAEGKVADLLAPYRDQLLPDTLEGYEFPTSSGRELDRGAMRRALGLMEEAGWTVENGRMVNASGAPFTFEIVLEVNDDENQSIVDTYVQALRQVGIEPRISVVDAAQYTQRINTFDFGMTPVRYGLSLSPGNEQYAYFGQTAANTPGSRNIAGIDDPVVDALIAKMLDAEDRETATAATRALDRVLTAGRYAIPLYAWNESFDAHVKELHYPEPLPLYGDWILWRETTWYWED